MGRPCDQNAARLARRCVVCRDSVWQAEENNLPESLRIRRPHSTRWFRWEDELRRNLVQPHGKRCPKTEIGGEAFVVVCGV